MSICLLQHRCIGVERLPAGWRWASCPCVPALGLLPAHYPPAHAPSMVPHPSLHWHNGVAILPEFLAPVPSHAFRACLTWVYERDWRGVLKRRRRPLSSVGPWPNIARADRTVLGQGPTTSPYVQPVWNANPRDLCQTGSEGINRQLHGLIDQCQNLSAEVSALNEQMSLIREDISYFSHGHSQAYSRKTELDNDRFRSNCPRVALELEDILGVPVDFNCRSGLKDAVRRPAEADARRVF